MSAELQTVLKELIQREPIFHRPEFGTSRADFERMTDEHFWEVGASGQCYSRAQVLDILEKRYATPTPDEWHTDDFQCRKIADDNYLLTYTLTQGSRVSRRATLWHRTGQGWKILYHQGTLVEAP